MKKFIDRFLQVEVKHHSTDSWLYIYVSHSNLPDWSHCMRLLEQKYIESFIFRWEGAKGLVKFFAGDDDTYSYHANEDNLFVTFTEQSIGCIADLSTAYIPGQSHTGYHVDLHSTTVAIGPDTHDPKPPRRHFGVQKARPEEP